MNKSLKKRLLYSFLLLLLGIVGFFMLLFVALILETKVFAKPSLSDQLVPNIAEGWLAIFFATLGFLCFLIWWSKRIISDIKRFRKFKQFGLLSAFILFIPFSPLIFFCFREVALEAHYYQKRKEVSIDVSSYTILKPENTQRIICTLVKNDTLFLVGKSKDHEVRSSSEQIWMNSMVAWKDELRFFSLSNEQIRPCKPQLIDTTRINSNLHWQVPKLPDQAGNFPRYNDHTITLGPPLYPYKTEIVGFEKKSRGLKRPTGFHYLLDDENLYYLFYTEEPGKKLSTLNLAEITPHGHKVHVIQLKEGDDKVVDGEHIIALYRDAETFYVIADTAVMHFKIN